MKRFLCLLSVMLLLPLAACAQKKTVYDAYTYDCFDTVCCLRAAADDAQDFERFDRAFKERLVSLDALFDAFGDREVVNIKSLNDRAGGEAQKIDGDLFGLLRFSLDFAQVSGNVVHPMMGAVTSLWKEATNAGVPPKKAALEEAKKHTDPASLILDGENMTARISDPDARIDVGATAKGYAARLLAETLKDAGCENFVLSLGGNILAEGFDPRTGKAWESGVQKPEAGSGEAVRTFPLSYAALVTGGSYERFFEYEGVRYHHIIDPDTAFPAARTDAVSVTVLHSDAALADALSTALFILPRAEGERLLEKTGGEALYINAAGALSATAGFPENKGTGVSAADLAAILFVAALLIACAAIVLLRRRKTSAKGGADAEAQKEKTPFPRFAKKDVVFFAVLAAAAIALPVFLFAFPGGSDGHVVKVYQNGEEICSLPLDRDATYRADGENGYNVVVVKDGSVYIADADCGGRDCVRTGKIDKDSLIPVIACLPHRLIVRIENNE